MFKIECQLSIANEWRGWFYIPVNNKGDFLHSDGKIRLGTFNDYSNSGYFKTYEDAQAAINRHKLIKAETSVQDLFDDLSNQIYYGFNFRNVLRSNDVALEAAKTLLNELKKGQ